MQPLHNIFEEYEFQTELFMILIELEIDFNDTYMSFELWN